jgi:hypothetical protein
MTTTESWAFFEREIAGRSTGAFLRSPDAVEAIASLTRHHHAETAASVQKSLMRATEIDVQRLARSGPRIALTNCHLANFAGSELWTEEVARYLHGLGLALLVFSPVMGAISRRMTEHGLIVTDDAKSLADFAPDIVHINHYSAVASAISGVSTRARLINMIHGLLPPPGLPARLGMDAYWSVALHATAKITLLTSCPWEQVRHIPNYFDESKFFPSTGQRAKRALLFSSKTTPDQRDRLTGWLGNLGFELDHIGYGGVPSSDPAALLGRYSLVFAVARSAIEALATGARVILWDSGVLGPMVTEQNFWTCVAANFSLASCVLPFKFIEAEDALDWLASQVQQPVDDAAALAYSNLALRNVAPLLAEGYFEAMSG